MSSDRHQHRPKNSRQNSRIDRRLNDRKSTDVFQKSTDAIRLTCQTVPTIPVKRDLAGNRKHGVKRLFPAQYGTGLCAGYCRTLLDSSDQKNRQIIVRCFSRIVRWLRLPHDAEIDQAAVAAIPGVATTSLSAKRITIKRQKHSSHVQISWEIIVR
jgi:hypothetical protein